jgi:hypothetical protein
VLYIANHLNWRQDSLRQATWVAPDDQRPLPSVFTFGASHQWQAPSGASDELFCTEFLTRQEVLSRLDKGVFQSLVTNAYWSHFLSRLLEREIECADWQARPFYLDRDDFVLRIHLCGGKELRSIDDPIFQALDNPDAMEDRSEIRFFLHFIRGKSWTGSAS